MPLSNDDAPAKSLRLLLPSSWRIGPDLSALIDALGQAYNRARQGLKGLYAETSPATITDSVEDWAYQQGVLYNPADIEGTKDEILFRWITTGASNLDYINMQVQRLFPDVVISYPFNGGAPYSYEVRGTIPGTVELSVVAIKLTHIMPVPYTPVFLLDVVTQPRSAMVGRCICGWAMVGREE